MTKHVLVLCQRKEGDDCCRGKKDVKESVVPQINNLVQSKLGKDVTIEYLSKLENNFSYDSKSNINVGKSEPSEIYKGIVDYDLALVNEPPAQEFIRNHLRYYSLIILNTCPLEFMDYNLIYNLLTPDGMLAITAYQDNRNNYVFLNLSIDEKMKKTQLNDFFEKIDNFLYKKKEGVADQFDCNNDYQCYNGVNGKCEIEDGNCYYDTYSGGIKRRIKKTNKKKHKRKTKTQKYKKRKYL